jgi:hypothetical protein
MRLYEIVDFDGTGAELDTDYAVSGLVSPFLRGNEAVLVVLPSAAFDGTVLVTTDNNTAGTDEEVVGNGSGGGLDLTGYEQAIFANITLGDNIHITTSSSSAGSCRFILLGNT